MIPGQLTEAECQMLIAHDTGKCELSEDAQRILDMRIQACAVVTRGLGLRTDCRYGSKENLTTKRKHGCNTSRRGWRRTWC